MSLYVRVLCGFYTHRKTLRLKAALGNDAYWIPPRLWCYAAEVQPDGVFADYQAAEIATGIGYTGNAKRMLQALLQAGFLDRDPLRIHDWHDHNGYHVVFADRAKKAAAARWQKERSKEKLTGQEGIRQEASIASSIGPSSNPSEPPAPTPPVIETWKLLKDRAELKRQIAELRDTGHPDEDLLSGLQAELRTVNNEIRRRGKQATPKAPREHRDSDPQPVAAILPKAIDLARVHQLAQEALAAVDAK